MRERLRPVPGLEVDDGAAPGGLGPADEVAGRRVLPGRSGPRRAQYLVVRLPEGTVRRVGPQQRNDVSESNTGQQYSSSLSSKSSTPAHTGWSVAQTRAVYRAYRNPESGQLRPRSEAGA